MQKTKVKINFKVKMLKQKSTFVVLNLEWFKKGNVFEGYVGSENKNDFLNLFCYGNKNIEN